MKCEDERPRGEWADLGHILNLDLNLKSKAENIKKKNPL